VVVGGPSYNSAYILDMDNFLDKNRRTMRVFWANNALHCIGATPGTCFVVNRGIVQKNRIVKLGMKPPGSFEYPAADTRTLYKVVSNCYCYFSSGGFHRCDLVLSPFETSL
jgi:hypothetical protein